ncbi:hypothetical protein ACTXT7_003790 [Hymenolepis weldensis]
MLKKLSSEQLQVAIDENPTYTTREGNDLETWLENGPHLPSPHDLLEINKQQRVTCCPSLRCRDLQAPIHN